LIHYTKNKGKYELIIYEGGHEMLLKTVLENIEKNLKK
jgi:hypothetical protein